jgi:UDP-glucose 4-epimerase
MKKIVVTGGAGYIGSHTAVELARAGYLPVVVDDFTRSDRRILGRLRELVGADFPVYEVDCRSEQGLTDVFAREPGVEGVIHFAAYKAVGESVRDPLAYYDNNVNSLVALLRAMAASGLERLVFSSSCTVYGQPDALPVTEATPQKPAQSPYGHTKQICEAIVEASVRSGRPLKAVTLRYFNPVGSHPSARIGELPIGKPENLVPYITQTAVGLWDKLTVFGSDYPTRDGTCVRDYIHVVDLADAHLRALEFLEQTASPSCHEVLNVGTGEGVSVLEAIGAFETATGRKLRYELGPRRDGDVVETYASVEKAARVLGWRASRSIVDAMRDAFAWQEALASSPLE